MKKEQKALLEIIERFPGKKILVWGDIILDTYIYGTTRRISREAPVLILSYERQEYALGGAGNALRNLKALGAEPHPIGVVGRDDAGRKILRFLKRENIATEHVFAEPSAVTPIKTRILAGEETTRKQQILRIDKESRMPDSDKLRKKILQTLRELRTSGSALLISDYHCYSVKEDVFRRVQPAFNTRSIPITLDSRFRLLRFPGVTALTPNEPEVEHALQTSLQDSPQKVMHAGRTLLKKSRAQALLITRGSRGMVLFENRRPAYSIPIYGSTDIVDVTGAGDTVISVFTLALACGANFRQAARLANFAGGIVVMKKGTAVLTRGELAEAVVSAN
ncbi:MAG: bifunctional heptose 7-phosphate kinase/heptose 1-phosphate adenyltransferase [Candidatus Aminicenantales bacterium]